MKLSFLVLFLALSCSYQKEDPLKNSRKLIAEGHASLYHNGAFAVPETRIKLIPPGPDAISFSKELVGLGARSSFLLHLGVMKDSMVEIYDGTKSTYKFSRQVDKRIGDELDAIRPALAKSSKILLKKSFATSQGIFGKTIELSSRQFRDFSVLADAIRTEFNVSRELTNEHFEKLIRQADHSLRDGQVVKHHATVWADGKKSFHEGYLDLPRRLKRNVDAAAAHVSLEKFSDRFAEGTELLKPADNSINYLLGDSFRDYFKRIGKSLSRASGEFNSVNEYGPTYPTLKALLWLLHGIAWEGVVAPLTKAGTGALGFVLINGVAYPVLLVEAGLTTSAEIAVQLVYHTGKSTVEIIAPSARAALAALLCGSYFAAENAAELGLLVANPVTKASLVATKATLAGHHHGASFVTAGAVKYIGAPLSALGIATVGGVSGVAVGTGGALLAGGTRLTGEVAGLGSKVISTTVSSTVLAGGVAYHTIKGTAEVAYEIGKGTVVPPSMALGGGVVLTYGSLVHLGAHSMLAVSDAAYLVLSMEGPSWVVYAVKGKLGTGEGLGRGSLLNLEQMREQGEEFEKVPVSDEEMKSIIDSVTHEVDSGSY